MKIRLKLKKLEGRGLRVSTSRANTIARVDVAALVAALASVDLTVASLSVNGAINAATGEFSGNVSVDNLAANSADVSGALTADNLTVADGASFGGNVSVDNLAANSADVSGALTADNLTLDGEAVSKTEVDTCPTGTIEVLRV